MPRRTISICIRACLLTENNVVIPPDQYECVRYQHRSVKYKTNFGNLTSFIALLLLSNILPSMLTVGFVDFSCMKTHRDKYLQASDILCGTIEYLK